MHDPHSNKIITYRLSDPEKEQCLGRVSETLKEYKDILFGYAFGSFLDAGVFRDLDIGVFLSPDRLPHRPYAFEFGIENDLERVLGQEFPVDVRILNSATVYFQYHAIRGVLLVDKDPDSRVEFITAVTSRYLDIQPVLRHFTKEAFANDAQP